MFPFSRPSVFTKSENCPSEVPPTAGRRGTLSPEPTPSATPTEVGVQRTSEILNEAILSSVSSVRDSLPEQHREHFETLRQEIIDFAQAHGIPRESLSKPDALREAASKLSLPDLERLATLLERFEYLLKNKEPRKEKRAEALEYAQEFYHLEKQYTFQVSLLEQVGILKEGAITGIDGKKYPVPTLEQIASRLFERRETLETKHDQGFTKLLLVPFGMSLDVLQETLEHFLLEHKKENPTFKLSISIPVVKEKEYKGADTGDSPKLVYYPQSFTKDDHGGKTKMQILEGQKDDQESFPGWNIHFLQPSNLKDIDSPGFAFILHEGQGTPQGGLTPRPPFRERGDRPPLEAGPSPNEYLTILQEAQDDKDSPYHGETGLTPEDWIVAWMLHFQETGKPLEDIRGPVSIGRYSCLIGAFFPSSIDEVPIVAWDSLIGQVFFSRNDASMQDGYEGARTSVMV